MKQKKPFSKGIIYFKDVEAIAAKIVEKLKHDVLNKLRRSGGVVGISGGIDSSVCLALSVKAFGPDNTVALMMPEKESSQESEKLARELAEKYEIKHLFLEDITKVLNGFKCYERRDNAVKRVFQEYDPSIHKMKIGIKQRGLFNNLPPVFSLTLIDHNGNQKEKTLNVKEYLQIFASSNFKQRARMAMLFYYAEAYHYAVIGTSNKHEIEQGFFVKYGDGGTDTMPIGNLYKSQVYQLADYFGIPESIINRTPTTDTYPAEQTQEEFFYQLPFEVMDLYWYGFENGYTCYEVATVMGETEERIESVFRNFARKKKTADYLKQAPIRD